jgi:hypothetical protein
MSQTMTIEPYRPDVTSLITIAVAARRLDVTPMRVRQMLAEGKLGFVQTLYGRGVIGEDVERLLAERQARGRRRQAASRRTGGVSTADDRAATITIPRGEGPPV